MKLNNKYIEDKVNKLFTEDISREIKIEKIIKALIQTPEFIEKVKGEDYVITEEDKLEIAKQVEGQIDVESLKGKDYVLTKEDILAIASKVDIKPEKKVIEKVIEKKTERIIEKPIINNEIKEVAVIDPLKIRDSLEGLEGDDRLDKTAIKGLDNYDELKKLLNQPREIIGGGSIARNFYQLFDVPGSYSGQSGKILAVKSNETGLEFITSPEASDVDSVTNVDGTLTISPTTGNVVASINTANDFISTEQWTGTHWFNDDGQNPITINNTSASNWETGSVFLIDAGYSDSNGYLQFYYNSAETWNSLSKSGFVFTGSTSGFKNIIAKDYFGTTANTTGNITANMAVDWTASDMWVARAGNGSGIGVLGFNWDFNSGELRLVDELATLRNLRVANMTATYSGTWNGDVIGVTYGGTGTGTTFTQGSVVFAGASGVYTQDNTNFFWDNSNDRLGLGTASPSVRLHLISTTEQIRIGYDTSNYFNATVGSTGAVTFDATGSGASFRFSDSLGIGTTPTSVTHIVGSQPSSVGTSPGTAATTVLTVTGGTGGNTTIATTGVGGIGAPVAITAGTGGTANSATTSATGGAGGSITLTSGVGGATSVSSSNPKIGGDGGDISITGSAGGQVSGGGSGTNTGGRGADISIIGGTGGAAFSGAGTNTAGTGGDITVRAGTCGFASTGGTSGTLYLYGGTANNPGSIPGDIYLFGGLAHTSGSGSNGGGFNMQGADAAGNNTASRTGGSFNMEAGDSRGDSVGGGMTLLGGRGGAGTGTLGVTGGSLTFTPGPGGVGSLTGGTGGNLVFNGGLGGDSGTDGAGGVITFNLASTVTRSEAGRFSNAGNFGLGTGSTVSAKLHVISTTEQTRIAYDTSNYFSTTVGSTGGVTFNAVGSGSAFTFSDSVNITSSLQCDSIVNDTGLASGTYTPTLTAVTNVTSTTARQCTYMRVGNTVTVAGQCDITPTGLGLTAIGISLPVASNFSTAYQAGGAGHTATVTGHGSAIFADATNDRVQLEYIDAVGSVDTMTFTFTYEVI